MSYNKIEIHKEFMQEKYINFRTWFFNKFNKEEILKIKDEFYEYIEEEKQIIPFVVWYIKHKSKHSINPIIDYIETWETIEGKKIRSVHPPLQPIKLESFEASPFAKTLDEKREICSNDINKIFKQNNHTNLSIQTLGKHLERIEQKLDDQTTPENVEYKNPTTYVPIIKPTIQFKPGEYSLGKKNSEDFLDILTEKFKNMEIGKLQVVNENYSDCDESDIEKLEEQFMSNTQINKIQNTRPQIQLTGGRYYYPRPSPLDLTYEEEALTAQVSYNPKEIYEWNIDGMTEYQVLNYMNKMLLYATASKLIGNKDETCAKMIASGFIGSLKGWWDNILTTSQ